MTVCAEEDKLLVKHTIAYIATKRYPEECSEQLKRTIRRKSKKFIGRDGEIFYLKNLKGKVSFINRKFNSANVFFLNGFIGYAASYYSVWCS